MNSTARRNNKKSLRLIYLLTWSSPCQLPPGEIRDDDQPLADAGKAGNGVATRRQSQPALAGLRQSCREMAGNSNEFLTMPMP
jgi:hypothetical protein